MTASRIGAPRGVVIGLYRRLLRELPPIISRKFLVNPSSSLPLASHQHKDVHGQRLALHRQLRSLLGSGPTLVGSTTEETSKLPSARQASQMISFLNSQRLYVDLLERYNPGLSSGDEDRIRLSARRVGLDLPIKAK